jgi:hypothetical protein
LFDEHPAVWSAAFVPREVDFFPLVGLGFCRVIDDAPLAEDFFRELVGGGRRGRDKHGGEREDDAGGHGFYGF